MICVVGLIIRPCFTQGKKATCISFFFEKQPHVTNIIKEGMTQNVCFSAVLTGVIFLIFSNVATYI